MKQTVLAAMAHFDRGLTFVLEWICIVLFAAITVILTLNIVVRFIPFMSMHSCMPLPSIFMLPMSPDWAKVAAENAKAAISVAVETSFMMDFLF